MASSEKLTEQQSLEEQDENLKGTLVSVLLLGAVIFVGWLGVWLLFLSR